MRRLVVGVVAWSIRARVSGKKPPAAGRARTDKPVAEIRINVLWRKFSGPDSRRRRAFAE